MSTDTMCSVMLSDVSKVFTHTFPKGALSVADRLFKTEFACDAINDVVGFT